MEEIDKEKSIDNYPNPVTIEGTNKILNQLKTCICKIENKDGNGTGFFCSIPYKNKNIKALITNNHVINQDFINENKEIGISLNDDKEFKTIELKNKKIYTSVEYDTTIIEIKQKENINNYLELDKKLIEHNINLNNKSIYILQYPKYLDGQKASVSYGIIKNIQDEYNIIYYCCTESGSSGSPILDLLNNKIIGIHKESVKNKNNNRGTLLKYPINEYLNKYYNNIKNEINITLNVEKYDINEKKIFLNKNEGLMYEELEKEYKGSNSSNNNNDNIIDLFYYIKEEKKIIKFINSDYKSYSIKIPISINKSDLYSIADNYKSHPSLKFILSYKNIMIKEDESSIEEIPEGAEINIIEERYIPNTCYYDSLKKKYGNDDIRNITFKKSDGYQKVLQFPGKATLSDVKISFYNKYGLNENMNLLYSAEKLKDNDERMIKDITSSSSFFMYIYDPMKIYNRKEFGKIIFGNLTAKIKTGEKEDIQNFKIEIGALESTSKLYRKIESLLCKSKKIKKLYLDNKEINKEDVESLKFLGIKEGFNVIAEL